MTVMLLLHYSKVIRECNCFTLGVELYLALKVDRCRTDQIAFVVRLLHRRRRLVSHHECDAAEMLPLSHSQGICFYLFLIV